MKKITLFVVLALSFPLLTGRVYPGEEARSVHVTFLHMSDFQGYDPTRLARQAVIVKSIRDREKYVFLVNCGDVTGKDAYTEKAYPFDNHGEMEFAALNAMHTDALVLGNWEFGTLEDKDSRKHLFDRIRQAEFPVLCANVTVTGGNSYIPGVLPYVIKDFGGVKIGFIGLINTRDKDEPYVKGFTFADEISTAKKLYPEIKKKADIVIALTHVGLTMDAALAENIPGLTAIFGGHTHNALHEPFLSGKTVILHSGLQGQFVGRMDLYFERKNDVWILRKYTASLIPSSSEEDPAVKKVIMSYLSEK